MAPVSTGQYVDRWGKRTRSMFWNITSIQQSEADKYYDDYCLQ